MHYFKYTLLIHRKGGSSGERKNERPKVAIFFNLNVLKVHNLNLPDGLWMIYC